MISEIINGVDSNDDNNVKNGNDLLSSYPFELSPLLTQIAGHGSEGDGQRAILKRADGKLLKPVQPPPKGQREVNFYTRIQNSTDPMDKLVQACVPEYFGVETIHFSRDFITMGDYLILRDITDGFVEPTIMDVKIGAKTYGPDASSSKMAQEDAKYVGTKAPFGYSVLGMIVHSLAEDQKSIKYDKNFGKTLKSSDVSTIPEIFFDVNNAVVPELMEIIISQMKAIYDRLEQQRKYKMFASSLLLAYDAAAVKHFMKGTINLKELEGFASVRIIDFAHVFDAHGERDDNLLTGFENLLNLFRDCLKTHFS